MSSYLLNEPLDPLKRGELITDRRGDGVGHSAHFYRLYVHERFRVLDSIVDDLGKNSRHEGKFTI